MKLTVVSTGFAPPLRAEQACRISVRSQLGGIEVNHICIDASKQDPPKSHFENLIDAIAPLPPDRIVASLDLDDWLGPPSALATVVRYYEAGAYTTYGSYTFADGRRGHARAYAANENIRRAPWQATHLKTFRAELFQKIKHDDLKIDGQWLEHARDLALMFPILEMAGYDRTAFIATPLVIYNYANSTEFNGTAKSLAEEQRQVKHVRSLPPYSRLQ